MGTNCLIFDGPAETEELLSYFTTPGERREDISFKEEPKDKEKSTAGRPAENNGGKRP